jgi:hypothetical protein
VNSFINDIDIGFSKLDYAQLPSDLLLSNRKDLKYIINQESIPAIFQKLKGAYQILEKQGKSFSTYKTNYYDTEEFLFYLDHHNGKLNRKKVRTRTYEDGTSFLEIKRKDNKGFTYKERKKINISTFSIENYNSFLDEVGGLQLPLVEKLKVFFDRVTLYDKNMSEKITFDFSYRVNFNERHFKFDKIVIVESKGLYHNRSFFNLIMNEMKIPRVSFSKYCFGLFSIDSSLKKNNFMPLLKKVKKILE